ncbi:MAG: chemotaxis protein CheA [Rhizomicrobium sp.]|jgi:two-component system chemotaxis sensor kinase CheA
MDELLNEFLTETNESLGTLDVELVRFERDSSDATILGNIFRLMHTIKGTCGFLGLPRLEAVAHAGENVLGRFRDGELSVTPRAVTLILRSIDHIRHLLSELEAAGREPEGSDADLISEINAIADAAGHEPAGHELQTGTSEDPADAPPVFDEAGFPVAAELLAEIAHTIPSLAMEIDYPIPDAPPVSECAALAGAQLQAETRASRDTPVTEVRESALAASSLRVNVDVIENLMTLISELVLTRNQLMQLQRSQKSGEFKVPLQRLSHITSELQDGVTRMRMQPIGNAWAKLPRIVRDLSVESGKKIELVQRGADTELDRQILEMIKDPLTHMIRNSADHGIESIADRLAAGKSETGTISLDANHEGGHIFIRIADDGRGLDSERIRRKAIANGLATEAELSGMSDRQIQQYVFRAGFSTAEKVTSVSGRGVGMDVVRTNVERIGGTIEMTSVAGQGTDFLIKIPLTLAIVSALIVESAGQRFAFPQINVIELVRASARSGSRIETIKNASVLRLRDRLLPLVSLRDLLGLGKEDTTQNRFVLVAQVGAFVFGIVVDRVFDTEEIVVKPVAPILRGNAFYAGNTILGDGSVIMILDPNGISNAAGQGHTQAAASAAQATASTARHDRNQSSMLLFLAGGSDRKAVPLESVARIEEVDASSIEHVGGGYVVQYRDHLMPLIAIDSRHSWKTEGKQPILVFDNSGRTIGIVVDKILDIARDHISIELDAAQEGFTGSAIIGERATDLIDLDYYISRDNSNHFRPDRNSKGTPA